MSDRYVGRPQSGTWMFRDSFVFVVATRNDVSYGLDVNYPSSLPCNRLLPRVLSVFVHVSFVDDKKIRRA